MHLVICYATNHIPIFYGILRSTEITAKIKYQVLYLLYSPVNTNLLYNITQIIKLIKQKESLV